MKSVSHSAFSEIEEFFMNYDVKARAYEALEQYLYRMTGKGHSIELKVNAEGFDVEDPQWDDAYQSAHCFWEFIIFCGTAAVPLFDLEKIPSESPDATPNKSIANVL